MPDRGILVKALEDSESSLEFLTRLTPTKTELLYKCKDNDNQFKFSVPIDQVRRQVQNQIDSLKRELAELDKGQTYKGNLTFIGRGMYYIDKD